MTTHDPADSTQTSRGRLLAAGKTLFAQSGYEQTSTAAIARSAGSSESQLIRYFGGKAGLLEAIFNESWLTLNDQVQQQMAEAQHGRDAILRILKLMIEALGRDDEIAFLFLFEGRRMRGSSHEVVLSRGFVQFWDLVCKLTERGQEDGSFRNDIPAKVLASAMLGCAEGMMRDRLINPNDPAYTDGGVQTAFESMVNGLAATTS